MQRAAAALAAEVRSLSPSRVLLLVGPGDNGGDALYAGAELATDGIDVAIVAADDRMHAQGVSAARAAGAHVEPREALARLAAESDVVIDALVGIGASGALRGGVLDIVEGLPAKRGTVVAVDIPSGVNPDDGTLDGPAIEADVTVTFGACKTGLLLEPGKSHAGRVVVVDLGLDLSEVPPAFTVAE